jgi:DNA invertase Pin-like site-specific DNA recombinase
MLEPAIDTGGPRSRMVLTVLGMVAEMELVFIRDHQRAGIDAAKAKGISRAVPPLSTARHSFPRSLAWHSLARWHSAKGDEVTRTVLR